MPLQEFVVIGRHLPTEKDPNPKIYRMRVFARNKIVAKSRFWYFLGQQKKVKKTNGEILSVTQIYDESPTRVKTFGVFLKYDSKNGTHNLYKEYRDVTRIGAVHQVYSDMAGSYRARYNNVQIISIDPIPASKVRRAGTKQFIDSKIKFPLPHRVLKAPTSKNLRPTFIAQRPNTHFS